MAEIMWGPGMFTRTPPRAISFIEDHHRCFGLGGYFMATVLAAAIYYRIGFSTCLVVRARRAKVQGVSAFHLEPGTIPSMDDTFLQRTSPRIPKKKIYIYIIKNQLCGPYQFPMVLQVQLQ